MKFKKNIIFDIFVYVLMSIFFISLMVKEKFDLAYIIVYLIVILAIIGFKINQLLKEKNSHR